jgi:DNA primase
VLAICEAPLDALSYAEISGQCKEQIHAVAAMGSHQQEWFLPVAKERGCKEVVIATDSDEAGQQAAFKWAQLALSNKIESRRHAPDMGKDWNDALKRRVIIDV